MPEMKYINVLRGLLANRGRVDGLVATGEQMRQAVDNQTGKLIEKTNDLHMVVDNQSAAVNERLGRLNEAIGSLAGDLNPRLDRLIEAATNQATDTNKRLDAVIEAITNQSTADNLRLDQLIEAVRGGGSVEEAPAGTRVAAGQRAVQEVTSAGSDGASIKDRAAPTAAWLNASPAPLPLPLWTGNVSAKNGADGGRLRAPTNALGQYQPLLDALQPWKGVVPGGYRVNFLGILTDAHFGTMYGFDPATPDGGDRFTEVPSFDGTNGEWWFEVINWLAAAREARGHFTMITLGAFYGAQAVGAYRVLQTVNPMPCKLVAVEPVPENYLWTRKHFRDNGIDPDAHWIVNAAISDRNEPVFFPLGGAGSSANCMSTDKAAEREMLAKQLIAEGKAEDALRNLMLNNTTGILNELVPGQGVYGEVKLLSAVTLRDLLAPLDLIDYLEADIQQSEIRVFPPFIDLLRKKVRRIHIGTHGAHNHELLHDLFARNGWEIVFSYAPDATYDSEIGKFELNDGVLTVRNPDL
jgi:hypothetical protein